MNAMTNIRVKNPPQLIDSIKIPGLEGMIGITSCPGMREEYIFDLYSESLIDDLQALRAWGASVVVTLLEESELHTLGVRDLGRNVVALNMIWLHLPVHNMGLPDERFDEKWRVIAPCLCNLLQEGKRIVIHCKEGLGRAGLVSVRLLIELGLPVDEAIKIVRKARPGSLHLYSHEQYCHAIARGRMISAPPAAIHAVGKSLP
jgi:ADP-ribosyl-[dinitrogen reductase] hydrolase